MSEQHDTFDARLRERFRQDAAGLDPQLRQRTAGAARARRRGERRRRLARSTFALGAVLCVLAAGLTAWQVHNRRDATIVVDPPPSTTSPSTTTPDPGTSPAVTVVSESTPTVPPAPPPTVAPDPTGAGALPLDWREVPAQVATWEGKRVVTEDGTTYSLFDANASTAVPGPGPGARTAPRTMTVARSRDGESWDTVATMPWANDIAVDGNRLYLAGISPTLTQGPLRLRLAESSDGGEGWTEADVEVSGFTLDFSADLTIPFDLGPSSNSPGATTTDVYGRTWGALLSLSIDPELVAGPSGVVVALNQRVRSSEVAARCAGAATSDAVYWYEYQDGYTVQVIPDSAAQGYAASLVRPGTPTPTALVRCTVPRAALDPARNDQAPATTALLRRSSVGVWTRLNANLPTTDTGWQLFPLEDGFVAQSVSTARVVSQRRSSDAANWSEFAAPSGWPAVFQGGASWYGQRAIGSDPGNHQVATSMDGGTSWQRLDVASLPVPDGTVAQRFQIGETSAGPWGFVIRYYPADGSRFWRMVATSRDGRTWTPIDEAAIGALNGPLGARLSIGGGFLTMTTNENTIDGRFVSKTFIGTPSG